MKNSSPRRSNFDLESLIRPTIKNLSPYRSARDEFSTSAGQMIFMDANENPYGEVVNRYPDPYQQELKAALANLRGVMPQQILVGNGSDEVLDLVFRVFCEPGSSNIITLPPTYGMYSVLAGINNIEVREIALDSTWQPEVNDILKAIDNNTRLIFFCSPNNPTGNLMETLRIKKVLENFHGIVIVDEAYIDFTTASSWSQLLAQYPNLLVVQTLSKAYALAGARVGYAITSPDIVRVLNTVKPPYNVNALSQQRALETLENPQDAHAFLTSFRRERSYLIDQLRSLDYVSRVFESEANFILFRVDDAHKRYEELLEKGIVVRKRSGLQGCENTLRVSIGTPEENKKLITVLHQLK